MLAWLIRDQAIYLIRICLKDSQRGVKCFFLKITEFQYLRRRGKKKCGGGGGEKIKKEKTIGFIKWPQKHPKA